MTDTTITTTDTDVLGVTTTMRDAATARFAAASPGETPETALTRALDAYRTMQLHHARLLGRQSVARGLNPTDVRFVFFLSVADGGVTPKQASEYLDLSTGATTSLVDRLVGRGHIDRRPNPEDRRSVLLHLTPSGAAIAHEIGAVYRTAFQQAVPAEYLLPLARAFEQVATTLAAQSAADGCPDALPRSA